MNDNNHELVAAITDIEWLLKQPSNYDRCEICAYNDTCERNQSECERDAKWRGHNYSSNRCVCCGEIIPEGRQVCPACEGRGNLV